MAEQILVKSSADKISRDEAWKAFEELRQQVDNVPEMSLEEINEEILLARIDRRRRLQKNDNKKAPL